LVKDLPGTLLINAPANRAGVANISGQILTGDFAINAGTVKLGGGNNTLTPNQFLSVAPGATLDLNGTAQFVRGLFGDGSALLGNVGTITNTSGAAASIIFGADNGNRNLGGVISGNTAVLKGAGVQYNFLNDNTYTGPTVFAGGNNYLLDGGRLSNTSSIDINYALLRMDENANYSIGNRINIAAPISLRGGSLVLLGRAQADSVQSVGNVTLFEGYNMIQSANTNTGINSATLNLASLARAAGSTATLRFPDNGSGLIGSRGRIIISTLNGSSTGTVGGGLTNNLIGPWAVVDREFASYIPDLGVGRLNQTGFAGYSVNSLTGTPLATDNIRVTSNTGPLFGNKTINTLAVNTGLALTTIDLGGNTLTLQGGGLLLGHSAANRSIVVQNGSITGGLAGSPSDLYVHVLPYGQANTSTILNAAITDNGPGGVVRLVVSGSDGNANLTLNATNTYTGGTVINSGVLIVGSTGVLPGGGITVASGFNSGSGILAQQTGGVIDSSNTITLTGNGQVVLAGKQTLNGLVFNGNGGGTSSPTVSSGDGILTIGAGGIVSSPFNPAAAPLVVGRIDLGMAPSTITVNTYDFNGVTDFASTTPGLVLGGLLGSSGGFTKNGAGVLQINQSIFTGPVNVAAGNIQSGALNGGSRFSDLTLQAGTSLNLNGQATNWGTLSGAGSVFNSVANSQTLTVGFNNNDSSFSGQLNRFNDSTPNSVNLAKVGTGVITITGVQHAQNGSTGTLSVNEGVVSYAGGGKALLTTQIVREGGTLRLDNSGTNTANRLASVLSSATNSTLNISGGRFEVTPNETTSTSELVTTLTVGNGAGEMVLDAATGSGILITAANLSGVQNGATMWLRGDLNAPGVSGTAAGFANLAVTNFPIFAGQQDGANGTFNKLIRPDIIASQLDGSDVGFATKDSVSGYVRPLAANEVVTSLANSQFNNFSISSVSLISGSQSVNSLQLQSGGGIANGNGAAFGLYNSSGSILTENIRSGGIIAFEGNTGLNMPALNSFSGYFVFHVLGQDTLLDVNSHVGNANGNGLWLSGGGTLNLNKRAYYTGTTTVNEGTLVLNGGENTIVVTPTTALAANTGSFQSVGVNGGVLDLNGNSQVIGSLFTTNPSVAGGVLTNSSASIATLVAVSASTTFAGSLTGNLNFDKSGSGTLVMAGNNTYTGSTIIRSGSLVLRDAGSILGTSQIAVKSATLDWDSTGLNPLGTDNPLRIQPSVPLTLEGGTFVVRGGGSADTTLTVDRLGIGSGASTVSIFPTASAGSAVQLSVGNLLRAAADRGTVNFTTNVGLGGSGNNNNAQLLVSAINGVGFAQNQLTNNIIGGWAVVNGDSFATYLDGVGVGALGSTVGGNVFAGGNRFIAYDGSDITATATQETWNISDTSNRTLTISKAVNSLRRSGATLNLGNGTTPVTLTLGAGLLTNNSGTTTISGGNAGSALTSSNSQLYVFTNSGNTVLNTRLTGAIDIVKSGTGTLILGTGTSAPSNDYTGTMYVNQGTLTLSGAASRIMIPGNLTVNNATVTFGNANKFDATTSQIAATSHVTLNDGSVLNMFNYAADTTTTLNSLTFNNEGGTTQPAVRFNAPAALHTLALSNANAITVVNNNMTTTPIIAAPVINNAVDFSRSLVSFTNAAPVISVSGSSPTGLILQSRITTTGGPLTKIGNGSLVLSGPNSFTGGIRVNEGALIIGSANVATAPGMVNIATAAAGTGAITMGQGTTIFAGGYTAVNATWTGGSNVATLSATNGRLLTIGQPVNGNRVAGGSTVAGVASDTSFTLSANATGTGTGTNAWNFTTWLANDINVDGDFTFGGTNFSHSLYLTGQVNLGNGAVRNIGVESPYVTSYLTGRITGTGAGLGKEGLGTLILLNSTNNYTGRTDINNGVVRLGVAGAIPDSSALTVAQGGVLDVAGRSEVVGSLAGGGLVTNSSGTLATLTVGGDNTSTTFNGILTAATVSRLSLVKQGSGNMTMTGLNTYSGTTTINGGTVSVSTLGNGGSASGIGAASNVAANLVLNGGTLRYEGVTSTTNRAFTIGTGGATLDASGSGALTVSASGNLAYGTNNQARSLTLAGNSTGGLVNTFSKIIGNNGTGATSLTKNGSNTWALTGANTYSGPTNVNGGTLAILGGGLGNTAITVANTATFAVQTNGSVNTGSTGAGTLGASLVLNAGSNFSMANNSSAGTLILAQQDSFAGSGLTIGSANAADPTVRMLFDIGSGSNSLDTIAVTRGVTVRPSGATFVILPEAGISSLTAGNHDLITFLSGGMSYTGAFADSFTLANNAVILGSNGYSLSLQELADRIVLNVTNAIVQDAYWKGGADASWDTAGNWFSDAGGVTSFGGIPGSFTNVLFNTNTGAGNFSTSLLTDRQIASLTFRAGATAPITISGNTLSIIGAGITTQAGTGAHVINSNIRLGSNQTWTVNSANALTVNGAVDDGLFGLGLTKAGTGTLLLNSSASTYTGATIITGGTLKVTALADAGMASSIGSAGDAAANLVINGGILNYTGAGSSSNRLFSIGSAGGTIDASGSGAVVFSGVDAMGFNGQAGARTLTLTGNNAGLNTIVPALGDFSLTDKTSLTKTGTGTWVIAPNNGRTGLSGVINGTALIQADASGLIINQAISGEGIKPGSFVVAIAPDGLSFTLNQASDPLAPAENLNLNITGHGFSAGDIGTTRTDADGNVDPEGQYTISAITDANNFTISKPAETNRAIAFNSAAGNGYTGVTTISNGVLSVGDLQNGGLASAIGASSNAASNLVFNGGTLRYTGAGASTNRLFTIVGGSAGTLDASGTGALVFSNPGALAFTGSGARTLTLTGSSSTTVVNTLSSLVGNGTGGLTSLVKSGSNTWRLSANNTYTGVTMITGGVLQISSITNGGSASNIGQATAVATNLVLDGGTLRYVGTGQSSNRLFSLGTAGGTLDASGTGILNLTGSGAMGFNGQSGARTLTLTGSNISNNALATIIGDSGGATSLVKEGTGNWRIQAVNTYTGPTTVNGGVLQVGTAATHRTGSGVTTVNSGGTLAGIGQINGTAGTLGAGFLDGTNHVVMSGGTLAPGVNFGSDRGTLTFNGNLLLDNGSSVFLSIANKTTNDPNIASALLTSSYDSIGGYRDAAFSTWDGITIPTGAHDSLVVNGQVTLNQSNITILDVNNYLTLAGSAGKAQVGDVFDLGDWLDLSSLSSFDAGQNYRNGGTGGGSLVLPTLGGGLVYDVSLFPTNGLITVITTPTVIPVLMNSYNLNGSGAWNAAINWLPATAPNSVGAVVNLTNNITSTAVVSLNGDRVVGIMTIGDRDNNNRFEIQPGSGGRLIFDNGGFGRAFLSKVHGNSASSVDLISAPIQLRSDLVLNANSGGAGARLDISGSISQVPGGSQGLVIAGAGRVTLSGLGANSYTGVTRVQNRGVGDAANPQLLLAKSESPLVSLRATTSKDSNIVTLTSGSTTDMFVGMRISGLAGVPANATVASVTGRNTFTISTNATETAMDQPVDFGVYSASTTAGSATVTLTGGNTAGFYPGMSVKGNDNIPGGATVVSVTNASTFVISQNANTTGTGVVTSFGTNVFNSTILGDLVIGSASMGGVGSAVVQLGGNEQIADSSMIRFDGGTGAFSTGNGGQNPYFKLMGYSETVAGIEDFTSSGVIENMEGENLRSPSTLTLNTASGTTSFFNGFVRDRVNNTGSGTLSLVVSGSGTQVLSGGNITYSGSTLINPGATLVLERTTAFGNGVGGAANSALGSRTIGNNGTLTFQIENGATWNFARLVSGSGRLVREGGTGTLNLNLTGSTISTYTSGSTTVVVGSTVGLAPGMSVSGSGIPSGAAVKQILSPTSYEISSAPTTNGTDVGLSYGSARIVNSTFGTSQTLMTVGSTADLKAGLSVTGAGIPAGAFIQQILSPTSFELSMATISNGTGVPLIFGVTQHGGGFAVGDGGVTNINSVLTLSAGGFSIRGIQNLSTVNWNDRVNVLSGGLSLVGSGDNVTNGAILNVSSSSLVVGEVDVRGADLRLLGSNGRLAGVSTLRVGGSGSSAGGIAPDQQGLNLINTAAATNADRIPDTASIILDAGRVGFSGIGDGGQNFSETLGSLTLAGGSNLIFAQKVNAATAGVTFQSIGTRAAGSTLVFDTVVSNADTNATISFASAPANDLGGILGGWAVRSTSRPFPNPDSGQVQFRELGNCVWRAGRPTRRLSDWFRKCLVCSEQCETCLCTDVGRKQDHSLSQHPGHHRTNLEPDAADCG
jgi:autotransporter-associated beta strand protein